MAFFVDCSNGLRHVFNELVRIGKRNVEHHGDHTSSEYDGLFFGAFKELCSQQGEYLDEKYDKDFGTFNVYYCLDVLALDIIYSDENKDDEKFNKYVSTNFLV